MKKEKSSIGDKPVPVFMMVPRKLVVAWIASFVCMLIMTGVSIQWASYVDRRSNQRWCGIVVMYNREFAENPPPSSLGQQLVIEFRKLRRDFDCK